MTFQGYMRMIRINLAFGQIQQVERFIDVAYDTGHDSLSGFTEGFKKATGVSPVESSQKTIVAVTRLATPLGPMLAGATPEGVCLLEFTDRRMLKTQLTRLERKLRAEILPGVHPHLELLREELKAYFDKRSTRFKVPLVLMGTDFQRRVWAELQRIPPGETRSYKEQAQNIGRPTATRAVARANGDNRIAIVIPCHRVIGSDGTLTGYGGGLWRKQWLLDHEKGTGSC